MPDEPEGPPQPHRDTTRDIRIPQVGETTNPPREENPPPEPRKIHKRRPLPPVPKKKPEPQNGPDQASSNS